MRVAYADPPYPGMARYYTSHPDFGGEVDHVELLRRLDTYDGWVLHTAATTLDIVLDCARLADVRGFRIGAWVKPFASFKPSQRLAYAWEPVLLSPCRSTLDDAPRTSEVILRDFAEVPVELQPGEPCVREPIAMRRGLIGAKPERVCRWAFEAIGLLPDDEFDDMFPGSGAVTRAHETWRAGRAGVLDEPGQLWGDDA